MKHYHAMCINLLHSYTDITVELYGSTYTGFALKDSDINMNLRFNDNTSSVSNVVIAIKIYIIFMPTISVFKFIFISVSFTVILLHSDQWCNGTNNYYG